MVDSLKEVLVGVVVALVVAGILTFVRKARERDLSGFFRALWQGPLIAIGISLMLHGCIESILKQEVLLRVSGWTLLFLIPVWFVLYLVAKRRPY